MPDNKPSPKPPAPPAPAPKQVPLSHDWERLRESNRGTILPQHPAPTAPPAPPRKK